MKNDSVPSIFDEIKAYVKTTLNLLKFESIEQCSTLLADLIIDTLVFLLFLIAFIFFSIALVAWAADILHSRWEACGVVALLYIVLVLGSRLLKLPIENRLIRRFIPKHSDKAPAVFTSAHPSPNKSTKDPMKILSKSYLKTLGKVIVATFSGFINDNGLKLSAALAYYTVFSIAPLLILIISITSIVFKQDAFNNTLYPEIKHFVGADAAAQIQSMVKNLQLSGKTGFALISGIVILLVGASSIFIEIQDSLNIIWRVKAKPKKGWLKMLQNRFLSFSLIISLGFLLLVSLLVNVIVNALSAKLTHFIPGVTHLVLNSVNIILTLVIIAALFGIIFKVLPDVKIKWRDVRSGAIFTAILFVLGQVVIGLYLTYSAQGSAYGAAGSLIVILVWIYYTSCILYIGAEFTQVYAEASGSKIEPADFAVHVQQTEVEREVSELPPQNAHLKGDLKRPD